MSRRLTAALAALDDDDRTALLMRVDGDVAYEDIGQALGNRGHGSGAGAPGPASPDPRHRTDWRANMNVTRDVILDVWPLYEANEVSADTRALVDGFLAKDAEFSRLLQRADAAARRTLGAGRDGRPADPAKTMIAGVRGRLARQRGSRGRPCSRAWCRFPWGTSAGDPRW